VDPKADHEPEDEYEDDDAADVDAREAVGELDGDEAEVRYEEAEVRYDEEPAELDLDSGDVVANARRRYGGGGALLAAGMLGLDKLLTDKKKPDSVQVQEAASEPVDVDKAGIQVMIDELTSVEAPPLERREPLSLKKKRSRRR